MVAFQGKADYKHDEWWIVSCKQGLFLEYSDFSCGMELSMQLDLLASQP